MKKQITFGNAVVALAAVITVGASAASGQALSAPVSSVLADAGWQRPLPANTLAGDAGWQSPVPASTLADDAGWQ